MWTRTRTALVLLVSVGLLGACKNEQHCKGNPNDDCRLGDASITCNSSEQCAEPTPVCDIGSMACVQCTPAEAGACTAATPVCGEDNMCVGCSKHTDCASSACLPDGSCGNDSNVAYVDPMGSDNLQCSKTMPCLTVAMALQTGRDYVKFAGTTDEAVTVDNGRVVTFLGDPDAQLSRTSGAGAIVTVRGDGTSLTIYDLSISNAPNNPSGIGMVIPAAAGAPTVTLSRATVTNNPGGGISASGGTLTVSQSTILLNSGGGVSITSAQFDITNTVIARNGGAGSSYGGLFLSQANSGTRRFEFNTVAQNQATTGITAGVLCAAIATPVVLTNSIVYDNGAGLQVEGTNCSWTYSDIGPMAATGTGNINASPRFVNAMQSNFHLQPGSPAKDAADPAASLAIDIDGDTRPQGDGRDMGADEIR